MGSFFKKPWFKYLLVAGLAGLWFWGLYDQIQQESLELLARYVGLSLALFVVAAA